MGLHGGISIGYDLFCWRDVFFPLCFLSKTCTSIKMRTFPLFLVRPELNLKLLSSLSNGLLIQPAWYYLPRVR